MRKAVKIILIVLGVVVIGVGIVMSVFMFRYARLNTADFGPGSMMGNDRWNTNDFGPGSMMGNDDRDDDRHNWMHNEFSSGLFGRMNDRMSRDFNDDCGIDRMGGGTPNSSTECGSTSSGMHGMDNLSSSGLYNQDPLTLAQAQDAVEKYIATLNNDDLKLAEVMIFDNQAYAEIVEKSTGIGAMEVLVDPATLNVFPEYGLT